MSLTSLCRSSTLLSQPCEFRAAGTSRRPFGRAALVCRAEQPQQERAPLAIRVGSALSALAAASLMLGASPALAVPKLPPIDRDPLRCDRAFVGNTIGQANAVSDKLLDLRQCDLHGANLSGKTLAGAVMDETTDLTGANMSESVLTKAYSVGANLSGADMTNAVIDRVLFDGANLTGVKFINAVITGTTFVGADVTDAIFEDALIGFEDAKKLCANPTLVGESRAGVGCRSERLNKK